MMTNRITRTVSQGATPRVFSFKAICAAGLILGAGAVHAAAGEMSCADYEAYVRAVGSIPPVLKTEGLENYSSNRLAFALMNALEMTRGGRIWPGFRAATGRSRSRPAAGAMTAAGPSRTSTS